MTNVNIFSSALSVATLKQKTGQNKENCEDNGDYLGWEEAEWDLKGDAKIQILGKADPCKKEPDMIAFSVEFPKMSDCMNHCKKIGGRAPKVVTKEQWHHLQAFMNMNFFDKKIRGSYFSLSWAVWAVFC